jgi:glutamate racemase
MSDSPSLGLNSPIGLFDSGIGGLTVLKSVREKLAHENFIYLGDTARLPYGSKSPETIMRYLNQNINFLVQHGVKSVVVACNSASSVLVGRPDLKFPVPIYNVIEPGAKRALEISKTKRIGVLGTRATIAGGAYQNAIKALDAEAEVIGQACPLLVPLVEEGWDHDPITNLVVYRYVQPLVAEKIDTLILGCTHYPFLRDAIRKVAGPNIELVDSAAAIAEMLENSSENKKAQSGGQIELLVTDSSPGFQEVAERLMSPFKLPALKQIDL